MPKKILLADDSITIQKVISITFATEDYELTIVGDGDSAIEKAKAVKPDLIMADVAMPGKTGYQVCDYIKNDPSLRYIPVILLSGTFEPLNKEEFQRVKADGNIVKPFESQELSDRVKEFLAKGEALREAFQRQPAEPAPAVSEARAPEKKPAAVPPPPSAPEIWEARDFIAFTEEPEEKQVLPEPSLDFLEGLEGPLKEELSLPGPEEFMDLGPFEETKPSKEEPSARTETTGFDLGPFEAEEFKPEPLPEIPKEEPFKAESFGFAPPVEPSKPEAPKAEQIAEEPVRHEELPWFVPERKPAEPGVPSEAKAAPEAAPEETDLLEAPAKLVEETALVEPVVSGAKEAILPGITERLVEEVTGKAEEKIKEDLSGRIAGRVTLPKEQIEDIVQRVAREVIEEIAWEVVPELAEDLIKAEINKIKEALTKFK